MEKLEDDLIKMTCISCSFQKHEFVGYKFRSLYYFEDMGVQREDKNPMVAMAQLVFNIF